MEDKQEVQEELTESVPVLWRRDYPRVMVVLLALVGMIIGGSVLGAVLTLGIGAAAGWSPTLLSGQLAADAPEAERWAMRTMLGINHFTTFILGGLGTVMLFYRNYRNANGPANWLDYLGIRRAPNPAVLGLGPLLMLVSVPMVLFLYNINQAIPLPELLKNMEDQTNQAIQGLLQMDNIWELLANLVIIALLPALGEELVFRGILQKQLHRRIGNPWVVILLSGAIFSFIHLQFEGFLPRWLLGILLGWLYWRSGSLWVSAMAHFFNNAIQVLGQYLYARQFSTVDLEKDVAMPWYGALAALLLTLWIMRVIDRILPAPEPDRLTNNE